MTNCHGSRLTACEDFLAACASELDFLVRVHGFEACEPERHGHECYMAYRKPPNMVLSVSYEPGTAPWITVKARLDADAARAVDLPLHRLARRRVEGWLAPRLGDEPHAPGLRHALRVQAELLEGACADVLEAADGIGRRLKAEL